MPFTRFIPAIIGTGYFIRLIVKGKRQKWGPGEGEGEPEAKLPAVEQPQEEQATVT